MKKKDTFVLGFAVGFALTALFFASIVEPALIHQSMIDVHTGRVQVFDDPLQEGKYIIIRRDRDQQVQIVISENMTEEQIETGFNQIRSDHD